VAQMLLDAVENLDTIECAQHPGVGYCFASVLDVVGGGACHSFKVTGPMRIARFASAAASLIPGDAASIGLDAAW
jgi:hypothetical protein